MARDAAICANCGHSEALHERVAFGDRRPCTFAGSYTEFECECANYAPAPDAARGHDGDKLICGPPLGPIYQSDLDAFHAKKRGRTYEFKATESMSRDGWWIVKQRISSGSGSWTVVASVLGERRAEIVCAALSEEANEVV